MTGKQRNIFNSALRLFASNGFHSTPTSEIAKDANVSEGLIFRHFKTKEGLLEAVMDSGLAKAHSYFEVVILEKSPSERIKKALSLPFKVEKSEYDFWRLTYALKWQRGGYKDSEFESVYASLVDAFCQLGYADPNSEAKLIEVFIDGMATELLLKDGPTSTLLLNALLLKYKLNNCTI